MSGSTPLPLAGLKQRLRSAGLKSTAPRLAVLRLLDGASVPQSHAEVASALRDGGFDQATLYRNLVDLAEAGLLVRLDLGDHVWRFEVRRTGRPHERSHPHFVCTDCGDVTCLPDGVLQLQSPRGTPKSVRRRDVAVKLQGVCDACLTAG